MRANIPKAPSQNEMMKQVQKMQADMQAKQAELDAREYEVSAGGG
ncbi:MAG: YbaB/EbfC family nucleoid-associated protein, partial [Clostridia bacterium]|nr:YbaB/EbfC family nucleoid-associated protein [Clostridia bacterium]